jgi:pimeloyl-ACP methyl ester carboxylesterase
MLAVPASSPASAVYHPAAAVPADVAGALRERHRPADDNAAVLTSHCPAVTRRMIATADGEVETFTAGSGPALLLLTPFNVGAGFYARQFAGLCDQVQLVCVHHPGVGATADRPDITLAGLAAMARDVLRELGVAWPVHVAGASFGGLAALSFALGYPADCASLILLGSSYKIGNRVGELNRLGVVAREDFDHVIEGSGSGRIRSDRDELEQTLLRCESMDPRIGLRYLDVFAARPDLSARLGEVTAPTLIIQGRHDTVIPLKTAHLLHAAIPDARYEELPAAGHFPGLTSPAEVNQLIAGFIAGQAGPGAGR